MSALKSVCIIGFLALANACFAQRTGSDDRYRILLSIDGHAVEGSQERALRLLGKSASEQEQILSVSLAVLQSGRSFQLSVQVMDPSGAVRDFSKTKRLKYEAFGCLAVSSTGYVTVAASPVCVGPEFPELWIAFTDASGRLDPISLNQYLFQVVP